jgi:Ca2+-binding EF-hand superfamily protein
VQTGQSYKFSSSFGVADKDGRPGVSSSTAYEHAFL